MINKIKVWWRERQTARAWHQAKNDFKKELAANVESFYVMQQTGKRVLLPVAAAEKLTRLPMRLVEINVDEYIEVVSLYNIAVRAWQEYERWYLAHVDHQSRETARTLHEKKDVVDGEFARGEKNILALVDRLSE